MKHALINLAGLLLALSVAFGGIILAGKILHWSYLTMSLLSAVAGYVVTTVYDNEFGTGNRP